MSRTIANVRCPAHGMAEFHGFSEQPDAPDADRTSSNVRLRKASRRPDRHGHLPIGGVQCPVADADVSRRRSGNEHRHCQQQRQSEGNLIPWVMFSARRRTLLLRCGHEAQEHDSKCRHPPHRTDPSQLRAQILLSAKRSCNSPKTASKLQ